MSKEHIVNPSPKTSVFFKLNGKLAQFRRVETGLNYWKNHWKANGKVDQLLKHVKKNDLHEYEDMYAKYLGKDGLIVEAGCGTGYVVEILRKRGYNVVGIDYEADVIKFAQEMFPQGAFKVDDVFSLSYPDKSIKYYISLGVLEHFEDGFVKAIQEVQRTLTDDGTALISVPYTNKARRAFYNEVPAFDKDQHKDLNFYQYYHTKDQFKKTVEANGLKVVDILPLFPFHFLNHEHPGFRKWLWNFPIAKYRLRKVYESIIPKLPSSMIGEYSHMMMYICKKSK
jgi:SAM-dependent methyltransferase